jgi:AcrR family transcriptional regulator
MAERGFAALTIEGVAARARVGKPTIYRRWGSKAELVRAAVSRVGVEGLSPPDTGSLRGDVLAFAQARRASARATRANVFIPRLVAEVSADPELRPFFEAAFVEPPRRLFATFLRRGIERGELRADLDVDTAVDLLLGPIVYRLLTSGGDLSVLDELPERLVQTALQGLAASSGTRKRRASSA